ncbi:GspH/FimT family pseudopilin [Sphingomonas aracearum]|uniref:Type II secretion system protein H n=1 Tax=Sphingomonas aracearum TaxID=2283317 RepID=A0A369VVR1_9SPHN|nr:GspH/FimT family pseudopilin [Sphingomonas aracearum]RDE05152.1 type II secretion system protein GspH [Sphingomonas aracearum]
MPISAAGNRRSRAARVPERGFTLVELMIVITIIGLASAAVALSLPDPRGRLDEEAERFAARTRVARDFAIINARPASVWVTAGGYGFEQRRGGAWSAAADGPLQVTQWGQGTRPLLATQRERIVFDPTGLADHGFDLQLVRDDANRTVRIGADGSVRLVG